MNKLTALAGAVALAISAPAALADKIDMDLTGTGFGDTNIDADLVTAAEFDQFGVEAYTTTVFNADNDNNGFVSVGDGFVDEGVGYMSSTIPALTDTEGFNDVTLDTLFGTGFELTFWWDDLTGYVNANFDPVYTGGTIHIQIDSLTPSLTTALANSYTNEIYDVTAQTVLAGVNEFDDGTLVFEMDVLSGGINPQDQSLILNGEVDMSNVPAGFEDIFVFADGIGAGNTFGELAAASMQISWSLDVNSDNWAQDLAFNQDTGVALHQSDHNGSLDFRVPAPATLAVMGIGLLGLGAVRRRKS